MYHIGFMVSSMSEAAQDRNGLDKTVIVV